MSRVFIYETLKNKHTLMKALREDRAKSLVKTSLPGWYEGERHRGSESYPTLYKDSGHTVSGDIIHVTPSEMKRLDAWESYYQRELVQTKDGYAWAYIYR